MIQKYSHYERMLGLEYLDKFKKHSFTEEELATIEKDPFKKELFHTVTDTSKQKLFLSELEDSGVYQERKANTKNGQDHQETPLNPLFSFLSNTRLYENLIQASEDNARRRSEEISSQRPKSVKNTLNRKNKHDRGYSSHL